MCLTSDNICGPLRLWDAKKEGDLYTSGRKMNSIKVENGNTMLSSRVKCIAGPWTWLVILSRYPNFQNNMQILKLANHITWGPNYSCLKLNQKFYNFIKYKAIYKTYKKRTNLLVQIFANTKICKKLYEKIIW